MTQVGEMVSPSNIVDVANDAKCPFCNEKEIGHAKPEDDDKVSDKVVSKPKSLGIKVASRKIGDRPHTTAAHHLISAMQCYAQLRRLVRMGNTAKYDINAKPNGIGLPTTHYTLKYPQEGTRVKYGDLDHPAGKKAVAFDLMRELKAQWHVGHHSFAVVVGKKAVDSFAEGGHDERDEDDIPHESGYDVIIVRRLLSLLTRFPNDLCEKEERDSDFKKEMDAISDDIRSHLDAFGTDTPSNSDPFYVSMRAYEYSGIADKLAASPNMTPAATVSL